MFREMKNVELLTKLKGFGIFLVVFGHSLSPISASHHFVYLFHLALFYFASGYFFKEEYTEMITIYIWKRIKSLYFPFIKYGLIFLALHNVFYFLNIYDKAYSFQDYFSKAVSIVKFSGFEPLLGTFWFLRSLFVVNVTFAIIVTLASKIHIKHFFTILLLLFTIVGLVASYKDFPLSNILSDFILLPISSVGFLWKKLQKEFSFNMLLFSIVIVALVCCMSVKVELAEHHLYTNPLTFYFVSFCGIYFCLSVCWLIKVKCINRLLNVLGYNTMTIFTWHFLAFKLVSLIMIFVYGMDMLKLSTHPIIEKDNLFWCFLYTLVGVALPLITKHAMSKIKNSFARVFL